MSALTIPQALALAPDDASAKAGQGLAAARHWELLGRDARALWGLCRGSGKLPYQTRVDLSDWASKCSCPSRKFPCKHALGLLLIYAGNGVAEAAAPAFVEEWLASREARAEKKAEREAREPADAEAGARASAREARRDERIGAGLAELKQWLEDLVDAGLANAPVRDASLWEQRARRLVDAQAPSLARSVAALHAVALDAQWHAELPGELALLHLACEAYARNHVLEPSTRADIERLIGIPQSADRLDWSQAVTDDWLCIGSRSEELDRLRVQRTWLYGIDSGEDAMLLAFAPAHLPPAPTLPPLSLWHGRIAFFPGSVRQRAQLEERAERRSLRGFAHAAPSVSAALERCGAATARDPWLRLLPLWVHARLARNADGFWLVDADGDALPLANPDDDAWPLYAGSLGAPQRWFGEWNGRRVHVLQRWPA